MGGGLVSRDHTVHTYKAWLFATELLPAGALSGWSDYWSFGYPAGELYPPGIELWVSAFRGLTFGALSWPVTYTLALTGFFAVSALALYALGRYLFKGPAAAWIAAAAALVWLVDPGQWREGGWLYVVEYGVWAQILAQTLGVLGLLVLLRARDARGRLARRRLALAALLVGASIVGHPAALLWWACALPAAVIARGIATLKWPWRTTGFGAAALALGLLVAAFFFVPMVARSELAAGYGKGWRDLWVLLEGLFDGSIMTTAWFPVPQLGLMGIFVAAFKRDEGGLLLALLLLLSIFMASNAFADLLVALRGEDPIIHQRLLIQARVPMVLLAAWTARWLATDARRALVAGLQSVPERARPAVAALPIVVVALASAWGAGNDLVKTTSRAYGAVRTADAARGQWWEDYEAFVAWAKQQRAMSDQFYRIAIDFDGRHRFLGSPVEHETPLQPAAYTPARLFKSVVKGWGAAKMEAMSVRWLLTFDELPRAMLDRHQLAFETRFGSLWLYRFEGYNPSRVRLEGPGRVTPEGPYAWRLSETTPDSRATLMIAAHPRWALTLDGAPLEVTPVPPYEGSAPIVMSVPARDGLLEARFVRLGVDKGGNTATWIGLALLAALALWPTRRSDPEAPRN